MKKLFIVFVFSLIFIKPCNAGIFSMIAANQAAEANREAKSASTQSEENSQKIDRLEEKIDKILEIIQNKK